MAKKLSRTNSQKFKILVPTFSTEYGQYVTSAFLARRLLCATYLAAFLSLVVQAEGLFGCTGAFRTQVAGSSLSISVVLVLVGLLGGAASGVGFVSPASFDKYALESFAALWCCFRVVCALAPKLWNSTEDNLLLDLGVPLIFLGRGPPSVQRVARASVALVLVRASFTESALRLLGGCSAWRDFTALQEIQVAEPFPTGLAWYAQHLPPLVLQALCAFKLYIQVVLAPLALCPAPALAEPASLLLLVASLFDSALASRGCVLLVVATATAAALDDRCVSRLCSWSLLEAWGCPETERSSCNPSCGSSESCSSSSSSSSSNKAITADVAADVSSAQEKADLGRRVSALTSPCSPSSSSTDLSTIDCSPRIECEGEEEEENEKEKEGANSSEVSTRSSASDAGSSKEAQLESSFFEEEDEDFMSEAQPQGTTEESSAASDSDGEFANDQEGRLGLSGEEADSEGEMELDESNSDEVASDCPSSSFQAAGDDLGSDSLWGDADVKASSDDSEDDQGDVEDVKPPSTSQLAKQSLLTSRSTLNRSETKLPQPNETRSVNGWSQLQVVLIFLAVFIVGFGNLASSGSPELSLEFASGLVVTMACFAASLGLFNVSLALLERQKGVWELPGASGRAFTTLSLLVLATTYLAGICQFVVDLKVLDPQIQVPSLSLPLPAAAASSVSSLSWNLAHPLFFELTDRPRCPGRDERVDLAVHGYLGSEEQGYQLIDVLTKYQPNTKGELRMKVVQPYTPRLDLELWRLAQNNIKATPSWLYPVLAGISRKEGAAAWLLTQPNEGISSWLYEAAPKYAKTEGLQGVRLAKATRGWSDKKMNNHRWWSKPAYKAVLEADLGFVEKIANRTPPQEHCNSAMWTLTFPVAEAFLAVLALTFSGKLLLHEPRQR